MSLNTIISLAAFGVAGYLLLKAHQSGALDGLFAPPAGGGGGAAPPAGGGCDCSQYGGGDGGGATPPAANGGAEEESAGGGGGDGDGGSSSKKSSKSSKKKSNYSISYMAQRVKPVRSAAGILAQLDPYSGEEIYYKAFAASSGTCKSVYNGSCNTECSKGSASECRDCQSACGGGGGGAQIGAVQGGQAGATRDSRRCSSEFNGSCGTECRSPNSTACVTCRAVCEGTFPPVVAPAEGDDEDESGGGSTGDDDESGPGTPAQPGSGGGGGDQTATDPCIAECAGSGGGGGGGTPAPPAAGGGGGGALGCGYTVRQMDSDTTRWRTDDAQGNEVSGGKTYLGSKAEQEAWSRQHCQQQGGGAKSAAIFIHASNGRDGRGTDRRRRSNFARFYGEGRFSAGNRIGDISDSIYPTYIPPMQQVNATYPWDRSGTEGQVGPYAMATHAGGVIPNRNAYSTRMFRSRKASVVGLPRKAYYVSDIAYSNTTENQDGTARDMNRLSMNTTFGDYRYIARPQTAARPVASTVSLF